jgi:hypothetical protein
VIGHKGEGEDEKDDDGEGETHKGGEQGLGTRD